LSAARLPIVVLISGRGSNMMAIVEAARAGLPVDIRAVISNRPDAAGLGFAAAAGVPTEVVDHTAFPNREDFEHALRQAIDRYAPGLVVLAGFMRVLGSDFVRRYRGRLVNIHPALLPAFPGLDTHRRAIEAGVREHGASVHFVTEEVDAGPMIVQARVTVLPGDSAQALAARVLEQEHRIYPQAIRWFAEGRLRLEGKQALLDGRPVSP
jgi:phosphoribosylglycinamide formyltransferase-1